MKIISDGHVYLLKELDHWSVHGSEQKLVFVKREGHGYPGNEGHHPGTTMQEVLRAVVQRAEYVQGQIPCEETAKVIELCSEAIYQLEKRAARRHGRQVTFSRNMALCGKTCDTCGHVGCDSGCRR